MGPIFNPFFWLMCIGLTVLAVIAAAFGGIIVHIMALAATKPRTTEGHRRRRDPLPAMTLGTGSAVVILVCLCIALGNIPFGLPPLGMGYEPLTKPSSADIVGIWEPIPASITRLEAAGYVVSTHQLIFQESGSVQLINVPNVWLESLEWTQRRLYSAHGTWEIGIGPDNTWGILVKLDDLPGYENHIGSWFLLGGRTPPYTLYFYWDDSDTESDTRSTFVFQRIESS